MNSADRKMQIPCANPVAPALVEVDLPRPVSLYQAVLASDWDARVAASGIGPAGGIAPIDSFAAVLGAPSTGRIEYLRFKMARAGANSSSTEVDDLILYPHEWKGRVAIQAVDTACLVVEKSANFTESGVHSYRFAEDVCDVDGTPLPNRCTPSALRVHVSLGCNQHT